MKIFETCSLLPAAALFARAGKLGQNGIRFGKTAAGLCLGVVLLFTPKASADTSYLLIQGPFGASNAEETFQWKVNYQSGSLITGQDLLNAILGTPSQNGTYTDAFSSTFNLYSAGNSAQGASYIDFGTTNNLTEPFVVSFTMASTTVAQDTSYINGWNYYVAGGGGAENYPNTGAWNFSEDGSTTRTLSDGSYDAWVFGSFSSPPSVDEFTPTTDSFTGATVINIPEPASTTLVFLGAGGLLAYFKRRRI